MLSQLEVKALAVHPDRDVADAGPGVEPESQRPKRTVIRRPRKPGEAERCSKRAFQAWCAKCGPAEVGRALDRDWERLVTFYQFPREHWKHLRTSNPVESPVRGGPAAYGRGQALQAGRQRDGGDLEDVARRRENLPAARRARAARRGRRRRGLRQRSACTAVKGPEIDRSALIIVDMQNDFLHGEGSFGHRAREHPEFNIDMPFLTGTISNVKGLADAFREAGRPVVYVAHVMTDYSDATWPYWGVGMEPGSGHRTHCVEGTWGHRSSTN